MPGKVEMRPEQQHLRLSRFRCAGAPPRDLLAPVRPSVAPVDQEELHPVRRREVSCVIHAPRFDAGPDGGLDDPRGDDQVSAEEDDRHSAGAGSEAIGTTGAAGRDGSGRREEA